MSVDRVAITERFKAIQDSICAALEQEDGTGKFREDAWGRPGGGGGRTRVLSHGTVIEKGGVNFSAVHGPLPEMLIREMGLEEGDFFATGVSIVQHPNSPHVPIIHMNIRYFEMSNGVSWFGGGIDLTPHYVDKDQAKWFHTEIKKVCDRFDAEYYPKFKKWADDYFYVKHREETRGVGGIFFDKLKASDEKPQGELFEFTAAVGEAFAGIYTQLMNINKEKAFSEAEKQWQLLRRGRYVEFNLVHDRGTKFGLETGGRIESILMSLPEHASWIYDHKTEAGSREEETLGLLVKGVDWV
jgi:coproporphyrinogen III oxidase